MKMNRGKYEYLDEVALADVAFRARGATLEEILTAAADATLHVMLPDPASLEEKINRTVEVFAENDEMLLFKFLEEFVFLKDAEQLLLRVKSISVEGLRVRAECAGDKINPDKYDLGVDVKAVTMHLFSLRPLKERPQGKQTPRGFEATVVLDI